MKKLFPKVLEVKVTVVSFIGLLVVSFLACVGINSCIKLLGLPHFFETLLLALCTIYFSVLILIGFLNLIGVVKVKRVNVPDEE